MSTPDYLHSLAIVSLVLGLLSAVVVAADVYRHPQHMWIMNVVWPASATFGSAVVVWTYFNYGRLATHQRTRAAAGRGEAPPSKQLIPFPIIVAKGALHCGSGCALGDIVAEWLAFLAPAIAVWFGWHSLFPEKIFAVWVLDYIFAFILGIAFQYFTIAPMRNLSLGEGLAQALKADVLSLTAWQVGMYGFMALAQFYFFRHQLGVRLEVDTVEFWFMMQIAMWAGFATCYPVNWWLITSGIKERM